jgi:hypothetical protein
MNVTKKTKTTTTFVIELNEWEVTDLTKILRRIHGKDAVRKSEFTLREKVTGRKLLTNLQFPN